MNSSLEKLQAWYSRRKQLNTRRSLEHWERIRGEGKVRFIFETALTYTLTVSGVTHVAWYVFGSKAVSPSDVCAFVFTGIIVAFGSWHAMEGKYKKALIDARRSASPGGQLPLHNSPLQITIDSKIK